MRRAPLPALRRLFAIGGAPAASHRTLARAPSGERLLDPLARERVVHDTWLNALARSLDVGAVLARVVTTASAATALPEHAAPRDAAGRAPSLARDTAATRDAAVASNVASAVGAAPRALPAQDDTPPRVRPPLVGGGGASPTPRRATGIDSPRAGRTRWADVPPVRTAARGAARANSADPRALPSRARPRSLSPGACAGAATRVVLATPVAGVDRLLGARPPGTGASEPAKGSRRDIGAVLADAVACARTAPPACAALPASGGTQRPDFAPPRHGGDNPRTPTTTDTARAGGFRGLAERAWAAPRDAKRGQARRIAPEPRTLADLSRDTLDAAVADSLARVLEREARRQGIDLAEART